MNSLQSQLQQIAAEFVASALELMRSTSLADLVEPSKKVAEIARPRMAPVRKLPGRRNEVRAEPAPAPKHEGGRRPRASAEEVKRYKDLAFHTAKQMPPGFSKGDLMKRTGGKVEMGRFLGLLVDEGLLVRKGERRAARYWVK